MHEAGRSARDILPALIAFETVSSASNLPLNDYVVAYLRGFGINPAIIPDATGRKASLLATIGSGSGPGIVLSGHTDVVPVEGQGWSTPPFEATETGGRIYGRGATDMKGFVAAALAAVPRFLGGATGCPIHLALSYDEEIGCRGAPDLVAAVAALPHRPALCIVGEPTGLRVARAHKGKLARRVVVTGKGGHSALPHKAANAVDEAVRIAAALRAIGDEMETARGEAEFDPPWTSLHLGSLHGGGALNLVPDRATLEFEIRPLPGADMASILRRVDAVLVASDARLRARDPSIGIVTEELADYPALDTPQAAGAVAATARLAQDDAPGITIPFGTEAGLYAAAGIPTVVCGPGDIGRAHKADEWIGFDELAGADRMMARLADACGRPAAEWIGR